MSVTGNTRYASLEQALFLEENLYASVVQAHPAAPESISEHHVRQVILLTVARPELFNEDLVRAHVAHLQRLEQQGRLELCGPFADQRGGMIILRNVTSEEARAIAEADPFVSSRAETYELRTWTLSCRDNRHMGMG